MFCPLHIINGLEKARTVITTSPIAPQCQLTIGVTFRAALGVAVRLRYLGLFMGLLHPIFACFKGITGWQGHLGPQAQGESWSLSWDASQHCGITFHSGITITIQNDV
jgi:hypothetical protein